MLVYWESLMPKKRGLLLCSVCQLDVTDKHANIMVNQKDFDNRKITGLKVMCKRCTKETDPISGRNNKYHHIWELYSVREHPWGYFGEIVGEVLRQRESDLKWDKASIDSFVDILIELLPEEDASNLLQNYFAPEEWNLEGPRSKHFRKVRNLAPHERPDSV